MLHMQRRPYGKGGQVQVQLRELLAEGACAAVLVAWGVASFSFSPPPVRASHLSLDETAF